MTTPDCWHKGERDHLGYKLHSECLTEPALQLSQLQPVDLIRLSHFTKMTTRVRQFEAVFHPFP